MKKERSGSTNTNIASNDDRIKNIEYRDINGNVNPIESYNEYLDHKSLIRDTTIKNPMNHIERYE
jgi:hypothetical protein